MSTLRNSVQLIGHLGADPEIKTLENGTKVARIRIATTESYKNKSGEWMDETTWHNVVAWEALAERAEKYLHKGSFVVIEGKLTNRSYVNQQGETKYVTEVRASNFMLLDKKPSNEVAPVQHNSTATDESHEPDLPF